MSERSRPTRRELRTSARTRPTDPSRTLRGALALAVVSFALGSGTPASGHPMGSRSISHYAGIEVGETTVRVTYVLDFAEMTAFRELERIDPDMDDRVRPDERRTYLDGKTREILRKLRLEVNGELVAVKAAWSHLEFPPGEGGFSTVRLAWELHADLDPANLRERNFLVWSDRNHEEAPGWKEIRFSSVEGIGIEKTSLRWNPASAELTEYPDRYLDAPPTDTKAWCHFGPGLVPAAPPAPPPPAPPARGPLAALLPGADRRFLVAGAVALVLALLAGLRVISRRGRSS